MLQMRTAWVSRLLDLARRGSSRATAREFWEAKQHVDPTTPCADSAWMDFARSKAAALANDPSNRSRGNTR